MKDQKRLGQGLEDVSHLFFSAENEAEPSQPRERSSEGSDNTGEQVRFPRVVAVTGDHRNLEKSFLVCNLAVELARRKRLVRVIDADLSFPDQPFLWGLRPADSMIRLAQEGENSHQLQVALQGPLGVKLLSLDVNLRQLNRLPQPVRQRLWDSLRAFEADAQLMLVNTPATLNENARLIHQLAHQIVVLVPSDPLGMMDAYSVMKNILTIRPKAPLAMVTYQVRMVAEAQSIAGQMTKILSEFLNVTVDHLGHLFADLNIEKSILRRSPLSLSSTQCKAAQCLAHIAERIWARQRAPGERTDRSLFDALCEAAESEL